MRTNAKRTPLALHDCSTFGLVTLASVLLIGCQQPTDEPPAASTAREVPIDVSEVATHADEPKTPPAQGELSDEPEPAPGGPEVQVSIVDFAGFEDIVGDQQGNVVLVDMWALW